MQANGAFLIPTLFLRVVDGATSFDLAVPNVAGTLLFGAGGDVVGLASSFAGRFGAGGILTVNLVAVVPEPGTALLLALGVARARAARIAKEIAR